MNIRRAVSQDIEKLVRLRLCLFAELGEIERPDAAPMLAEPAGQYFASALADGSFVAWLAGENREIISTGSLVFFARPPYYGNLSGRGAYLLNMYTVPRWCRQSVAAAIVWEIVDYIEKERVSRVWLHVSQFGRSRYEKAGFTQNTSEMEWTAA